MRINFIAGLSRFLYQPVFFCQCKSLYCGLRCIGAQKIFKRDSRTKGMQRRRRLHRIRPFWYVNKQALLRPARGSSNCREGPAWQAGCMEAAWHPGILLSWTCSCIALRLRHCFRAISSRLGVEFQVMSGLSDDYKRFPPGQRQNAVYKHNAKSDACKGS